MSHDYRELGVVGFLERHFDAPIGDVPRVVEQATTSQLLETHSQLKEFFQQFEPSIEDRDSACMIDGMQQVDVHDYGDRKSVAVQMHQPLLTHRQMIVQIEFANLENISKHWQVHAASQVRRIAAYAADFEPLLAKGIVQPVVRPLDVPNSSEVVNALYDSLGHALTRDNLAPVLRSGFQRLREGIDIRRSIDNDQSAIELTIAEILYAVRIGCPCHFNDPDTLDLHTLLLSWFDADAEQTSHELAVLTALRLPFFGELSLDDLIAIRRHSEEFDRVRRLIGETARQAAELTASTGCSLAEAYARSSGPLEEALRDLERAVKQSPALSALVAAIRDVPGRLIGRATDVATAGGDFNEWAARLWGVTAESAVKMLMEFVSNRRRHARNGLVLRVLRAGLIR